jgi:hypothetical protein
VELPAGPLWVKAAARGVPANIVLVAWLLTVVTLVGAVVVDANLFEYGILSPQQGVRLEDGWEPMLMTSPSPKSSTIILVRRSRLRRPR